MIEKRLTHKNITHNMPIVIHTFIEKYCLMKKQEYMEKYGQTKD
jgi:hypothetical protein